VLVELEQHQARRGGQIAAAQTGAHRCRHVPGTDRVGDAGDFQTAGQHRELGVELQQRRAVAALDGLRDLLGGELLLELLLVEQAQLVRGLARLRVVRDDRLALFDAEEGRCEMLAITLFDRTALPAQFTHGVEELLLLVGAMRLLHQVEQRIVGAGEHPAEDRTQHVLGLASQRLQQIPVESGFQREDVVRTGDGVHGAGYRSQMFTTDILGQILTRNRDCVREKSSPVHRPGASGRRYRSLVGPAGPAC
jgi:hypothetical protein